jgi:ADP-ribose pyrophosphatase
MPDHTKNIFTGQVVKLGIESLVLPNGKPLQLEVVRHPGGAAVAAVNPQREVCLLRQFRHAAGGWLWELPAGKLEPGEPPLSTAARELAEEAGVAARDWQKLGASLTTPGFCDEIIHLYLARDLTAVPAQPGEHEVIEVHWLPFAAALEQVFSGEIRDAKTMLGLLLADREIHQ